MSNVTSTPILVVDDYQTMRTIIIGLLRQLGFNDLDQASDGEDALTKIKAKKYGLIFSDWNMEPMSGIELLKHTRTIPDYKGVPFILVTAENTADNIVQAKSAGATNYIVKPFTAQVLKAKLEIVFGSF